MSASGQSEKCVRSHAMTALRQLADRFSQTIKLPIGRQRVFY